MKGIIFLSIYLVSCLLPTLILAQYPQMDFPLQIGNIWQYNEGTGFYSESRAVKDTVMPNGFTYTQIKGPLFSGYFRKEGTKIFVYNTSSESEFIKYDFSLKVGDTLQVMIYDLDTTLITVSSAGVKTFFGTQRNYMSFFRDNLPSTGDGSDKIADGLGLVQYSGEVLHYGLTGAIINGVTYGQILDVDNSYMTVPGKFRLFQNYPNPFNPTTIIKYSIPSVGTRPVVSVQLKIYDMLGREVSTLVNEEKSVGNYEVNFDGSNLSSGVYFYRLQAGSFSEAKKLMLVK